jgi:Mycothiol maleylpyruvate isomerase N-terminal domain
VIKPPLPATSHLISPDSDSSAAARLHDHAEQAGRDAAGPSCPDWDVAALVTHQGMVHRWAIANVRREPPIVRKIQWLWTPQPELLDWFDEGAQALVESLIKEPAKGVISRSRAMKEANLAVTVRVQINHGAAKYGCSGSDDVISRLPQLACRRCARKSSRPEVGRS